MGMIVTTCSSFSSFDRAFENSISLFRKAARMSQPARLADFCGRAAD
jgi:hypothetical protein